MGAKGGLDPNFNTNNNALSFNTLKEYKRKKKKELIISKTIQKKD